MPITMTNLKQFCVSELVYVHINIHVSYSRIQGGGSGLNSPPGNTFIHIFTFIFGTC